MTTVAPAGNPQHGLRTRVDAVFGQLHPPTGRGWTRVALIVGLVVAGTVISLLRTPRSKWNVLWAEDGAVFLSAALNDGPQSLLDAYAGYLHLVPRIAAQVAAWFPIEIVPLVVSVLAALSASSLACANFVFMETKIRSLPLRFTVWVVSIALPTMGGDVTNNLANLHWYLLLAGFCAAMARSRSVAFAVVQCVVVVAAVASSATALLLAPFLIARWWLMPGWRDRSVAFAFVVGAALQLVAVTSGLAGSGPSRRIADQLPTFAEFLDFYVYRVLVVGLFGMTGTTKLDALVGVSLPGVTLAAIALAIGLACRVGGDRRASIATFAAASIAFGAFVYSVQWYAIEAAPTLDFNVGMRYAVVPTALVLLALVLAADVGASRVRRPGWSRLVAVAVLIAVLIPAAVDYRSTIGREAPSWSDSLSAGRELCAAEGDPGSIVTIPIAPVWFGGMRIPCGAIAER